MRSASQMLHAAIGAPTAEGCVDIEPSACWLCGGVAVRGIAAASFCSSHMTDQNQARAPDSNVVCEACCYVRARCSPVPGRPPKEGKLLGGNFRNYSHLFDAGASPRYRNASKGEKPAILAFLRAPKRGDWFAAIADSGQLHVLPYAPMNAPGARGLVLFDQTIVRLPDVAGWALVEELATLLTAGASKEEVARGEYRPMTWQRCEQVIREFEGHWSLRRHGSWFGLALWLAQRDEEAVQRRVSREKEKATKLAGRKRGRNDKGEAQNADDRVHACGPQAVPPRRCERDQALGPASEPMPERVPASSDTGGLVHQGAPGTPNFKPGQLGLFDGH